MAGTTSMEDIQLAISAMSRSRLKQHEDRAALKGISLQEYLRQKLDPKAILGARARLQTFAQAGSAPVQRGTNVQLNAGSSQNEAIVISDDGDEVKAEPPIKRRKREVVDVDNRRLDYATQPAQSLPGVAALPQSLIDSSPFAAHLAGAVPRTDPSVGQCSTSTSSLPPYGESVVPLSSHSYPSSSPRAHGPSIACCTCGRPAASDSPDSAICANGSCDTRSFHRACVGLSKRLPPEGWRCWKCRPKSMPIPPSEVALPPPPGAVLPYAETEPELSEEQRKVVSMIELGSNVFYTGSAGTGKSTVLKSFVKSLQAQGKKVDIVAPSGIAALAVGGTTIFSYAGWTPDHFKKPLEKLTQSAHGKNVHKRLCRTDCLVIDEISMVERDLLVRLDRLMREARHGYRPSKGDPPKLSRHSGIDPFGGVQMVVTGDFCQLPPVKPFKFCVTCGGEELEGWARNDGKTLTCHRCKAEYHDRDKWAFASELWRGCKFEHIELSKIHRQSDQRFIDILQTCRIMEPLSHVQQQMLLADKPDPENAVKLMPTRAEVDRENTQNFRNLPGRVLSFDCRDMFDWKNKDEPELRSKGTPKYPDKPHGPLKALNDHRFEEHVDLKKDMRIILLVNLDLKAGLVNGSQGRIVGFEQYDPTKILVPKPPSSSQMSPKRYSRKEGESSLEATSYKGSRKGPSDQLGENAAVRNNEIHSFMRAAPIKEWPIVDFTNGVRQTIYAHCQLNELGTESPFSLLGRTQIPLLASWAITCHKSQGMTLSRVIVDLHNSFERGMVYVALSRARNMEGLKVLRLPKSLDMPGNIEVQEFLKEKFGRIGEGGVKQKGKS